jgi:hypothetical protein
MSTTEEHAVAAARTAASGVKLHMFECGTL